MDISIPSVVPSCMGGENRASGFTYTCIQERELNTKPIILLHICWTMKAEAYSWMKIFFSDFCQLRSHPKRFWPKTFTFERKWVDSFAKLASLVSMARLTRLASLRRLKTSVSSIRLMRFVSSKISKNLLSYKKLFYIKMLFWWYSMQSGQICWKNFA